MRSLRWPQLAFCAKYQWHLNKEIYSLFLKWRRRFKSSHSWTQWLTNNGFRNTNRLDWESGRNRAYNTNRQEDLTEAFLACAATHGRRGTKGTVYLTGLSSEKRAFNISGWRRFWQREKTKCFQMKWTHLSIRLLEWDFRGEWWSLRDSITLHYNRPTFATTSLPLCFGPDYYLVCAVVFFPENPLTKVISRARKQIVSQRAINEWTNERTNGRTDG